MFLNDQGPIAGGREPWGFQKKRAQPTGSATRRSSSRPPASKVVASSETGLAMDSRAELLYL
jgi:hypothetical protein